MTSEAVGTDELYELPGRLRAAGLPQGKAEAALALKRTGRWWHFGEEISRH